MDTCALEQTQCFLDAPADIDRQCLFYAHMDWAAIIARNIHRSLPPSFYVDDLIQEAYVELWKRAQSYDPGKSNRGIPVNLDGACQLRACAFEGYAYPAVRGAVLMSTRRRHYTEATHESLTRLGTTDATANARIP